MPPTPDLGLDGVDLLPGGEIAFSIESDLFSETLGDLHEGDLLSDQGRVMMTYSKLITPLGPEPPPLDLGLDAADLLENGEILFSIEKDFFSESLGRSVRKGDLLSSKGFIVRSNEQLVARFQPADPKKDYGLDAIFVWPNGEVWFSVETGFYGQHFEPYNAGDLLSDQGYVVYRNLELLGAFQPLEDLADFGLDALWIVTDLGPGFPTGRRRAAQPSAQIRRAPAFALTGKARDASFRWNEPPTRRDPGSPLAPSNLKRGGSIRGRSLIFRRAITASDNGSAWDC
jgi:hypothetical protein